jgi:Dyp-type peroxidase family
MAGRAQQLGDVDVNHRRYWDGDGPGSTLLHAVAIVYAATPDDLDQQCKQVRYDLAGYGEVVHEEDGHRLEDEGAATAGGHQDKSRSREHFGFVDGLSQPIIEGLRNDATERLPGQGVLEKDGTWRPLRAGEIILGYPDEEDVLPASPTPPTLGRNGTYLVYRKLYQNVAAFRRLKAEHGKHYPGGEEMLAAKMVGRTTDGTPLASPEPGTTTGNPQFSAFTYADDREGLQCPVGAHIRRVNPRDGFEARDRIVHRHRMLRRGIPYGPPLPNGVVDDDGEQRGLLFVCLCASIARQFEFVQGQWSNDGNILGLGNDQDPLLSNASDGTTLTITGARPFFLHPIPPLVTVRGGEYFFLPGRRALGHLANGPDLPINENDHPETH